MLFRSEIKMEEDESFDEFYAKLKDIVNSAFNLGETIHKPKIVKKVLKSLLERFHAKITATKESKDIDKIPLTELVGNLQTYELGLTRIVKESKSKSMALKAKSNKNNESSDDEDSKMKSYIQEIQEVYEECQCKRIRQGPKVIQFFTIQKLRKGRRMLRIAISSLFPSDQSVFDVMVLDI